MEPMTPTIGRQVRMGTAEHDALMKAAPRGQLNAYIIKALRAQLRRDGHLTADDDKQQKLFPPRRRRAGKKSVRRTRAR